MRFLVAEKLGPHKFKTPEGYLICTDAILSRTGKQEYKRCEIFGDACDEPDKIVNVDRVDAEVFSDKAMASFENKPICIEHPDHDVNAENHNELAVGFVRDVHKGEDEGKPVMMGTLVITDKDAVEAIESGEYKELSCGYDCDIDDNDEPCQRNIRGNHVALCKHGRAGIARIVDSVDDARFWGQQYPYELWLTYPKTGRKFMAGAFKTHEEARRNTDRLRKEFTHNVDGIPNAEIRENFRDSVKDVNDLTKFKMALRNISKMYSNDPGIEYVTSTLKNLGYDVDIDSIDGWKENKNVPGEHIKQYRMNVMLEGRERHFLVQLYADMGEWKVKEINAYMLDSNNTKQGEYMKDEDFSKKTKQGFTVVEMYRDGGRLHAIVKRSSDYVVALGYDTSDGTWAQGRYVGTYEGALSTLKEEKPGAKKIQDAINDGWSKVEEENDNKANKTLMKDKQLVRSSSDEIHVFKVRGKYEVNAYNRNNLDYNALQQIENKFNVNLRRGDYDYITIISANKDAIYKAFAAINPAYAVGSWRIEDEQDVVMNANVTKNPTNDAKTEYVFNWQDTYHNIRDKTRVDANNIKEAIRKFGDIIGLGGLGTANCYVISISPNDGYLHAYGRLSALLRTFKDCDMKDSTNREQLFTVEYKQGDTTYIRKVRASSIEDAISKVKDVYNAFEHETDKEYLKSSIDEMSRYIRNWSYMSTREKREISPEGLGALKQMLKFAQQRLAELK